MRHLLLPATLLLSLAGCGGGGGDQPVASGGGGAPAGAEIGRRAVPGYAVVVTREAGAPAGTYRVEVLGSPAAQGVAAWVACCGYDPPAATTAAVPIAGSAGAWRIALPAASGKLWLRITDAGGNLLEVGGDDFPLSGG
jgi:hypothetical protein